MRPWLLPLIAAACLTTLAIFCARGPTLAPVVALDQPAAGPFRPRPPRPPEPPAPQPPLPEPANDQERVLFGRVREWARQHAEERVEERLNEILDADPDVKTGPGSLLAGKLVSFIWKAVKVALEAAVAAALTAAVVAFAWAHWHYIAGVYSVHVVLSWLAGWAGGKKAAKP